MKNKKLFAILTLVCFMFTLMPVAAFAAPTDYVVKAYDDATGTWVETIYAEAGYEAYVNVANGDEASFSTTGAAFYVKNSAGVAVQIGYVPAGGAFTTSFTLPQADTYYVYAVADNGADTTAAAGTDLKALVDAANSLVADTTVADAVAKIEKALKTQIAAIPATVVVDPKENGYVIGLSTTSASIVADSGFTGIAPVTVTLTNNTQKVVGKAPVITAPEYVTVAPAYPNKTVTDATGTITYNITASKAGTFKVVFGYEDADEKVVTVTGNDGVIANVEVAKTATAKINNDYKSADFNTGATLSFTDNNGVVVKPGTTTFSAAGLNAAGNMKVTVVSQPTGSRLNASNIKLVADTTNPNTSAVKVAVANDLKEGKYEVKLALANGKSVTVAFEAAKMSNKIAGIKFVQPATTAKLGADVTTGSFTVYAYDANGVTEQYTEGVQFDLSAQGVALKATPAAGYLFSVQTEEKFIGSTITVLAKTIDNKFVITTPVEVIADSANEIVYVDTTAEVGVSAALKANVLDAKGNKVTPVTTVGSYSIIVLEKPENAYVSANVTDVTGKTITVTFLGSVAGEYKIQTICVDNNNKFVVGTETIKVGANEVAFKDVIVMSIGANKLVKNDAVVEMPAAPEIVDSRTMVPARAGLEAFGAVVAWDEATQTVTAELNGVKVVMTIGEKAYTVNGKAVVGDAAPYISTASTMVPVSFFTNAFGITATPIYDANGVCDVLFTK